MRTRNRRQTAILDRGLGDRQPNCQLQGFIGFGKQGDDILMPGCGTNIRMSRQVSLQRVLRWFHPHLLNRACIDFRADDGFDHVQNLRVAQQIENGWSGMHMKSVGVDPFVLQRQRNIQKMMQIRIV